MKNSFLRELRVFVAENLRVVVAYVFVAAICAADASAQTTPLQPVTPRQDAEAPAPRRPFRGLFGGNEARPDQAGLSLRTSTFGGHDDNFLAEQQGGAQGSAGLAAWHSAVSATLQYTAQPGRGMFHAAGTSQLRFYMSENDFRSTSHTGQVTFSLPVRRTGALTGASVVRYSPYYQLRLIPGMSIDSEPTSLPDGAAPEHVTPVDLPRAERDLTTLQSIGYLSNVGFSHGGPRTTFRYAYAMNATTFESGGATSRIHRAGGSMNRKVNRYGTLQLGYRFQQSVHGLTEQGEARVHDILLGGGYERPLSFSRSTTVGFSGGTSMIEVPEGRQFRLLADATVRHEIGRSWLLRGVYNQGTQFSEAFADPLYARGVRTTLAGLLNRRADLSLDAGYARGQLQARVSENPYTSYEGVARLRVALTRAIAVFGEYSYFAYDFDTPAGLPGAFAQDTERQAVRIGFDWWLPLYSPRPTHAPR